MRNVHVSLSGPGKASQQRDYFAGVLQGEEESISDVKVPGGGEKGRDFKKHPYNETCNEMPFM